MKKWILIVFAFTASFNADVHAQQPDPQLHQRPFAVCAQRDKSVSLEECQARIALIGGQHFKECEGLAGDALKTCVVKVPSKINPPKDETAAVPPPAKSEDDIERAALEKQRQEVDKRMAEAEINKEKANAEIATLKEIDEKQQNCLSNLRIGFPRSAVKACGTPDRINTDRYSEQWVYPNVYVYVSKGVVENIQRTITP